MSAPSVTVRMYRRLLGDCFLIRIEDGAGGRQHILIDCGLLQGLEAAGDRMRVIAADIATTTGGKLDLLVVTHQHHDHISGFAQARSIFLDPEVFAIENLWMAWTEDPADPQAKALRDRFERRGVAISAFAHAIENAPDAAIDGTALIDHLDRFIGPVEYQPAFGMAPTGRLEGSRILAELKGCSSNPPRYLAPGDVVETPGAVPLQVAVLGPPRAEARLFKDLPSRGPAKETYLDEEFFNLSFLGVDGRSAGNERLDMQSPFGEKFSRGLSLDEIGRAGSSSDAHPVQRWLHAHYLAPTAKDDGIRQDFRRIDDQWAHAASEFAIKLDSDTNNSSLVLAFALPDDSFMLFAADAQVGNWLSWHDQCYAIGDKLLTAETILNRTRLYKVAHHGSHNATLREKGLEMMTHPELVAMVSTVETEAEAQGSHGWLMPNPDVKAALLERCQGRLIIGDRDWASDADTAKHAPGGKFAERLDESNPLYVEYRIFEGQPVKPRSQLSRSRKMVFNLDTAREFVINSVVPMSEGGTLSLGVSPAVVFESAQQQALLVGSEVLSFDTGVAAEFREAVSNSALLAQLIANQTVPVQQDPIAWFDSYFGVLGNLGWVTQSRDTAEYKIKNQGMEVHEAIIQVVQAFLGNVPGAIALVKLTLDSLKSMSGNSPLITLFSRESQHAEIGRFQFTYVHQDPSGGLLAEAMAFSLHAEEKITQILFFKMHKGTTKMRRSLGSVSLNRAALTALQPLVYNKISTHLANYVAALELKPALVTA